MTSQQQPFDFTTVISYLGLPAEAATTIQDDPIGFLSSNLRLLPPHLSHKFSLITSPKQRTSIPIIRNRRYRHIQRHPFTVGSASAQFPSLDPSRRIYGKDEGAAEKQWAQTEFLKGSTKHVGKLGELLGNYEEEREAERVRNLRRSTTTEEPEFVPEEDESDSEEETSNIRESQADAVKEDEATFLRRLNDRFVYGLLEGTDYDAVDWDETLDDENDREAEARWFDDDNSDEPS